MLVRRHSQLGRILCIALACLALCATGVARSPDTAVVPAIDATHGVGLEGYDAVAYFLDHRPIRGSDAYTHSWNGAVWKFISAEHRDLFAADPAHYAPQYGGYCAFAMADGSYADIDPFSYKIIDGKLYLNYDSDIQKQWEGNRKTFIESADRHWAQERKK